MPIHTPPPPSACRDLAAVRTPDGRGLYASAGELFRDATFGRDAIEAAEDLLPSDPEIARQVIFALARLQGTTLVPSGVRSTEEEPGRIHHESRLRVNDGRVIDAASQALLDVLAAKWGGDANGMTYYGSVDATPLFVRLVDRYCQRMGSDALLEETVVNKDGVTVTVRDAALAATRWVAAKIEISEHTSGLGILEHHRRNPRGLEYQDWLDGRMSHLHPARVRSARRPPLPDVRPFEECGEMIDPDQPHAFIEVQGVAYDALLAGARLAAGTTEDTRFASLAVSLRDNVIRHFWMPGERYFAAAIDRDAAGRPRQVKTVTAAPAELLDTTMFDALPRADRQRYITALVRHIGAADMMTAAGVRTVSLRHRDQLDHVAYQGVFTVWHKQTSDIARGLRHQGFDRMATQLENRIVNTCNASGLHAEYVYVDGAGRVCLDPANTRGLANPDVIAGTNIPEAGQTWTVSAVLAIKRRRSLRLPDTQPREAWAQDLENGVLRGMPAIVAERTRSALEQMWARGPAFVVDRALGDRRQAEFTTKAEAVWRRGPGAAGVALAG